MNPSRPKKLLLRRAFAIALGMMVGLALLECGLALLAWSRRAPRTVADSSFVVLCLGSSITRGDGAPSGEDYPSWLEHQLRDRWPRLRARVVNGGQSNGNTTLLLENLPALLREAHPQVVTLMVGEPNLWNRYGFHSGTRERSPRALLDRLAEWSRVARWVSLLLPPPANEPLSLTAPQWLNFLGKIRDVTSLRGPEEVDKAYALLARHLTDHPSGWERPYVTESLIRLAVARRDLDDVETRTAALEQRDPAFFPFFAYLDLSEWLRRPERISGLAPAAVARLKAALARLGRNHPGEKRFRFAESLIFSPTDRPMESGVSCDRVRDALVYLPLNTFKHTFLSECYAAEGRDREAVDVILGVVERDPLSPQTPFPFLERVAHALKDPAQARRLAQATAKLRAPYRSKNHPYHGFRAQVLDWIESDLERMLALVSAAGAKTVILSYPPKRDGLPRPIDGLLPAFAARHGLPFIDVAAGLRPRFLSAEERETYYSNEFGPEDHHLSGKGNRAVAEVLADGLERSGMIPISTPGSGDDTRPGPKPSPPR